jgi:ubiquinone/menaquinone biosynthesis C-methylase UbiE
MNHDEILRTNRRVYDSMAAANDPLCRPAKESELQEPLTTLDASGWLGSSIVGQKVLCLAAGGGRQSSLYAEAGAKVTVVDLSGAMLELDRQVAKERGYSLRLLETTMEDLSGLDTGEFDIVIHPVSTCYVPDVRPVFAEVARVLRGGGIYISQHKQPTSLQTAMERGGNGYLIQHEYYRDTPVPSPTIKSRNAKRLREHGAVEFLHRWEQIVGGICRAGFAIEDLTEPLHAKKNAELSSFADRATFVAPYVRIKARRNFQSGDPMKSEASAKRIWVPGQTT